MNSEKPNTTGGMRGRLAAMLEHHRSRQRTPRFSNVLKLLVQEPAERVTLGEIVETFEDRAFGALMFIFAAPNIIPLPPGTSSVLGLPLILVAAQLAIGRRTLWLPSWLRNRSFARADLKPLVDRMLPALRRTERLLAPRLDFMFGIVGDRVTGVVCLLLSVILFLPIPLGNLLPGVAVALFALALIQRDGIAALAGWVVAAGSVSVLVAISGALWVGATAFFKALL